MTDHTITAGTFLAPDLQQSLEAAARVYLAEARRIGALTVPAAEMAEMTEAERTGGVLCAAIETLICLDEVDLIPCPDAMFFTMGTACPLLLDDVGEEDLSAAVTAFARGLVAGLDTYAATPVPPEYRQ